MNRAGEISHIPKYSSLKKDSFQKDFPLKLYNSWNNISTEHDRKEAKFV